MSILFLVVSSMLLMISCSSFPGTQKKVKTRLLGQWECSVENGRHDGKYTQTYFRDGSYSLSGILQQADSINGEKFKIRHLFSARGEWSIEHDGMLKQVTTKREFQNLTNVPGLTYQQNIEARKFIDSEMGFDKLGIGQSSFYKIVFKSETEILSEYEGGGNKESCHKLG